MFACIIRQVTHSGVHGEPKRDRKQSERIMSGSRINDKRIPVTWMRDVRISLHISYVFLFLSIFVVANAFLTRELRVSTKYGEISGKWSKTIRGRPVANYLKIPYAVPPVGDLRFRNPKPWNQKWREIYNATEDAPMCVQLSNNGKVVGDEDCLYLNIFVPIIHNKGDTCEKFPVMVYVHGGKYEVGSSNSRMYAPDYLLDQNLILVTLNYRLNIFGFYSTGNKISPGNYGLKDIVTALKWIHENIESFGGDVNSVTLNGHNAGANAVHLLALTNKTEGLFHRYITQSGSPVAPCCFHDKRNARLTAFRIARLLGCHDSQINNGTLTESWKEINREATTKILEESFVPPRCDQGNDIEYNEKEEENMLECLRSVDAKRFLRLNYYYYFSQMKAYCKFGPTIEEEAEDAVVTVHPYTILKKQMFRDIPWMAGMVKNEGLIESPKFIMDSNATKKMEENFEVELFHTIKYEEIVSNITSFASAIEEFYFGGNVTGNLLSNITELIGDAVITWPMYEFLKRQSTIMNSSAYFYVFAYEGTFSSTLNTGSTKRYGVSHGDDLNYLFPIFNYLYGDLLLHNTEADTTMINIMTELWSSFITNGVPRAFMIPEWPDFRDNGKYLQIGNERSTNISVQCNYLSERMAFWKNLTEDMIPYEEEIEMIVKPTLNLESNAGVIIIDNTSISSLLFFVTYIFYVF